MGSQLLACIIKELLLLIRDRAGLLLLFVMPAFLVIVITLIQDKVTSTHVDVLFVDKDGGFMGQNIRDLLGQATTINLIEEIDGEPLEIEKAHDLVSIGKYQFAIILPEELSKRSKTVIGSLVNNHLLPQNQADSSKDIPEIRIWFDPTVHGSFRTAVRSILNQVVRAIEAQLIVENTLAVLPDKLATDLPGDILMSLPQLDMNAQKLMPQLYEDTSVIPVRERFTTAMGFIKQPTAVQQNVPAWTIFGIFFIVVPLAGSLIKERTSGTLRRLKVLPVSYLIILSGKFIAYGMVCLVQFSVIIGAGTYFLPIFGLPPFDPGSQLIASSLLTVSTIAAACGYGILLGTLGKTYEQIAVFGPVSIVIAAAIGGIMVPVYALPDFLRPICQVSPLYWGLSGFFDLLLRGGNILSILPETMSLLAFCIFSLLFAFLYSTRCGKRL